MFYSYYYYYYKQLILILLKNCSFMKSYGLDLTYAVPSFFNSNPSCSQFTLVTLHMWRSPQFRDLFVPLAIHSYQSAFVPSCDTPSNNHLKVLTLSKMHFSLVTDRVIDPLSVSTYVWLLSCLSGRFEFTFNVTVQDHVSQAHVWAGSRHWSNYVYNVYRRIWTESVFKHYWITCVWSPT